MNHIDRIIDGIVAGLEGNVIFLPQDRIRALEDEVWAELSEWHDHEEATRRFLAWRSTHRSIGSAAIEAVNNSAEIVD